METVFPDNVLTKSCIPPLIARVLARALGNPDLGVTPKLLMIEVEAEKVDEMPHTRTRVKTRESLDMTIKWL